MKVLLNGLQAANRSGTGRYISELARHLSIVDADVSVEVLWPQGFDIPERANRSAYHLRTVDSGVRRVWDEQFSARRECESAGADAMHYTANHGNYFRTVRSVLTVHDLSFFRNPKWFRFNRGLYYSRSVARSCATASRIISVSQATADDLMKYLGVEASRIDVVHSGIDAAFRPESAEAHEHVRKKYKLPEAFFLYVGTHEPRKNLVRLVQAWTRIAPKVEMDLVIAGRTGWKNREFHAACTECAHQDRLHFPGYIDDEDLPALLSSARALVWPSLWEGFGWPPLEALACGTAVITSNVSSMPEVVGESAILVDPYDTGAIADAMLTIAEDSGLRERLGAAGPKRAANFSWERTAQQTLDSYRKLLN